MGGGGGQNFFQRGPLVLEDWSPHAPLRGLRAPSQRPSWSPSQSSNFLSELQSLLPLVVLPLGTRTNWGAKKPTEQQNLSTTQSRDCPGISRRLSGDFLAIALGDFVVLLPIIYKKRTEKSTKTTLWAPLSLGVILPKCSVVFLSLIQIVCPVKNGSVK